MTCYKTTDVGLEEVRTKRRQFVTTQNLKNFEKLRAVHFLGLEE